MDSPRFKLSWLDVQSWAATAALFLFPVAVIYIPFVLSNIQLDGFQWTDFSPDEFALGSIVTYILSETLALFKKWASDHTPKV